MLRKASEANLLGIIDAAQAQWLCVTGVDTFSMLTRYQYPQHRESVYTGHSLITD